MREGKQREEKILGAGRFGGLPTNFISSDGDRLAAAFTGDHAKPIRVVTSLNFYGEAATAVAGKYGQVTAFINSAATDPHEFQPTTAQAKELSQANVVIENGLGYDHWLSDMTKATTTQQTVVNVGQQVAGKKMGANEHGLV